MTMPFAKSDGRWTSIPCRYARTRWVPLQQIFTRRHDEALELARQGLELEPDSGFTIAMQGVAYTEQGRFEEAVERMNRAAQLDGSLTVLALQAHVPPRRAGKTSR